MKITVVTVCYNAEATLERTMLSVIGQTYKNIEYIIIDGGSTDGTVNIIKKYADWIAYWVSEPDKGIYDAMNKGINAATGEWINFMNSGDAFYDNEVVANVFNKSYPQNCNVIYGKVKSHHPWGTYIKTPKSIENLNTGMIFCHQSTFIRTSKHKEKPYDLKYKIVADFNFFHTVYIETPKSFQYYDGVIAEYEATEGVSQNHARLKTEAQAIGKHTSFCLRMKNLLAGCLPPCIKNLVFRTVWAFDSRRERVNN